MRWWLCGSVCWGSPAARTGCGQSVRTHLESLVPFGTRVWAVEGPWRGGSLPSPPIRASAAETPWTGPSDRRAHSHPRRLEVQAHGAKALWSAEAPPQRAAAPRCVLPRQKGVLAPGPPTPARGADVLPIRIRGGGCGHSDRSPAPHPFSPFTPQRASESWTHQRHLSRSRGS